MKERRKRREEGVKPFRFTLLPCHTPIPTHPSLPENAQYFPETNLWLRIRLHPSKFFFPHRRLFCCWPSIDELSTWRVQRGETRNYREQMLEGVKKKKKRKSEWICFEKFEQQRCDFFRLIRHSVALHPKEEEKRER